MKTSTLEFMRTLASYRGIAHTKLSMIEGVIDKHASRFSTQELAELELIRKRLLEEIQEEG